MIVSRISDFDHCCKALFSGKKKNVAKSDDLALCSWKPLADGAKQLSLAHEDEDEDVVTRQLAGQKCASDGSSRQLHLG